MKKNGNGTNYFEIKEETPIVFLMHHLSPVDRILNKNTFDLIYKFSPPSNQNDFLQIEIAGIAFPPNNDNDNVNTNVNVYPNANEWLDQLCQKTARVSCQLLARRKPISSSLDGDGLNENDDETIAMDDIAIAKVNFHPGWKTQTQNFPSKVGFGFPSARLRFFLWKKELASSLIENGRATVTSSTGNPLFSNQFLASTIESLHTEISESQSKHLQSNKRKDSIYLETLTKMEMKAAAQ